MLTPRTVVLGIPPLEVRNRVTPEIRNKVMGSIAGYNSVLPELASNSGASFVALPPMPEPNTIDGVHLNAAGYSVWDAAVLQGAAPVCSSNR